MHRSKSLRWLALVLAVTSATTSFAQSSATAELRSEVTQSQQRLARTEQRIAAANSSLNQQIRRAEQAVLDLRRSAAELQRSSDDQTLAIEVIEGRVQRWQEQERFQRNVLVEYARNVRDDDVSNASFTVLLTELNGMVNGLSDRLRPAFQDEAVILDSGLAMQGQSVQLGPVQWFVAGDMGGLTTRNEPGMPPMLSWTFDGDALAQLTALRDGGVGNMMFDPTLGRYTELQAAQQSIMEHITTGGVWALPILLFALISLSIAAQKTLQFLRLPKLDSALNRRLEASVATTADSDDRRWHPLLSALLALLKTPATAGQREDQVFDYLLQQRAHLNQRIGAIAVTATVSPLLGLLGTVSGMISTFRAMTVFGSGDPSVVSGGISEALVTTELGLVVAVPSLIAHALLKRKADAYAGQLEMLAVHLSERVSTETIVGNA